MSAEDEAIEEAFLKAVSRLQVYWERVDTKDWTTLFDQLDDVTWSKTFAAALSPVMPQALLNVAKKVNSAEPFRVPMSPKMQEYAEVATAKRIEGLTATTTRAVKLVLNEHYRRGTHPYVAAREVTPLVGLHERYAIAVERRAMVLRERGWKEDRILKEQTRYASKLARSRGRLVARTERIDMQEEAKLTTWIDARNAGELSGETRKVWVAGPSGGKIQTCDLCAGPLNGQSVPLDALFDAGNGVFLRRPPAHPGCRCPMKLERSV